uniref:Uncharacterized protein n=1 Tax=Chenopodium quinoa TaxID=63459 RepID=A0A803LR76_CHEQI
MVTKRTITSYFAPKKRERIVEDSDNAEPIEVSDRDEPIVEPNVDCTANEQPPSEEGVGVDFLMRDPGLRKQIETYDSDEKDLIRREYIDFGPYQPKLAKYPYSGPEKHPRRFQKSCSTKRHDELQETQLAEIQHLVEIEGLETGKGLNQIGTLQRPCDTRWSSHYRSICSLLRMYRASRSVLDDIASEGTTYAQRGDALNGVKLLMSFEFVFNLHVVKEIMAITDGLCQALQLKTQDVVNAMHLVSTTKTLLQNLRNDGWVSLWSNVRQFCEIYDVAIPDMNAPSFDVLKSIRRQSRQKDIVTMEHHYRVDIFFAAID